MLAAAFRPLLDDFAARLGVEPGTTSNGHANAPRSSLREQVFSAPRVAAIWGTSGSKVPTRGASVNTMQGDAPPSAGVDKEASAGTTSDCADHGQEHPTEHPAAHTVVESGIDMPESATPALSSTTIMVNASRSLPPASPTIFIPEGRAQIRRDVWWTPRSVPWVRETRRAELQRDVWWTPRPSDRTPAGVPPGVQTPIPWTTTLQSAQQARALTTASPPASPTRLVQDQESSAPAAPEPKHLFNAASPAVTRKRGPLADAVSTSMPPRLPVLTPVPQSATADKENVAPSTSQTRARRAGPCPYRIERPPGPRLTLAQMLALVDALVPPPPPPPPPPPASPVRPASPSTSGPWTPRTPVGVRADSPVEEEKPDPDRCVSPLDLPPAVYSVSFTAPMRIAPDSFREYPDRLPVPFPISAEHLAQRRAQHPGAAAEIADAGNVADDEDEPDEFDL